MKVLFVTYPTIGLSKGGMAVQIERTADALRAQGVDVERYDCWRNQIAGADVCHFFSTSWTMLPLFKHARGCGKPIVWSTVFNTFDRSVLGMSLQTRLSGLIPGLLTGWRCVRQMAACADAGIALNREENVRLLRVVPELAGKTLIIPNGLDKIFETGDPDLFRRAHGLGEYVLNVAYIGPTKNQGNLIRAMTGSPRSLVLIGQAGTGAHAYYETCRRSAPPNVLFAGTFPYGDPMLLSAYAGARVFALPSTSEVQTLALMEAALAGCRLVASRQVPIPDSLAGLVEQPSPGDPEAIRRAIDRAAARPGSEAVQAMRKHPDWTEVGRMILDLYERLLSSPPRRMGTPV